MVYDTFNDVFEYWWQVFMLVDDDVTMKIIIFSEREVW